MSLSPTAEVTGCVGFARDLAAHGDAVAVVTARDRLTYQELARRVDDVGRRLGSGRRLVLMVATNDLDGLVTYLAALSTGHPVMVVPGGNPTALASLTAAYDPDVVVDGPTITQRRDGSAHVLHPDLALLLSTSGSTGSPKLVRLSHANLQANAKSIAQYLGIASTDRAATTLPMSYCYGLSVINSHLLRGASLLLTDASVVDSCFWDLFRREGGTTFAGVPHTFELLDRVGFADMDLPGLRYVTQAGGRLAPDRVLSLAQLGQRQGWELFVMYGQTEATARMAYLPPHLAQAYPTAIGVPVPGGAFTLSPVDDHPDPGVGVGELVYSGPNVMLGYAERPQDLALGRVTHDLATGDLARRTEDGLFEVVGRRSRFVKVAGLRIDLQRVEDVLADQGFTVCCAGDDDRLVIAVEGGHDPQALRRLATADLGLPAAAVRVRPVAAIPRLGSGKPDYRAVAELAHDSKHPATAAPPAALSPHVPASAPGPGPGPGTVETAALRGLYAELLDAPQATDDDSFVSLGGDSLSYVEVSIRLEELLGDLPRNWHTTCVRDLVPDAPATRRRYSQVVETSVALRALAIVLIVATHAHVLDIKGSAHVLVAIAGFNFARFQLTGTSRRERLRHQLRSIARIAVPSMVWIGGAYLLTDRYGPQNVFLANAVLGPQRWSHRWDFWFVEVLVIILLAMAAMFAVAWVDRAERRFPFAFVAALVALGLVWRFELTDLDLLHTKPVFWLFALGWAAARSTTVWHRAAVTTVALAAVPGFFGDPPRDALILGGLTVLVWAPGMRCPNALRRVAGVLASASLYVYLTHWQVYPRVVDVSPLLAVVASLVVGVAYWQLCTRATSWLAGLVSLRFREAAEPARQHTSQQHNRA